MDLEIRVDRKRCMGTGQCVHWAPRVFSQDEDAIAVVVDPHGEPLERTVRALSLCPVGALSIIIDGAAVPGETLAGWHHGSVSDAPLVATLEKMGEEHEDIRTSLLALQALSGPPDAGAARRAPGWEALAAQLAHSVSAHLVGEEARVYRAMADLVDSRLIEAFARGGQAIRQAARHLGRSLRTPGEARAAANHLATAVDHHIRLEETVLFVLAIGALSSDDALDPPTRASRP